MSKVKIFLFLQASLLFSMPVLAQMDTVWVRRYDGPGSGYDYATALQVDDRGNVYVTGSSRGSGTGHDYATIKYSPNGDTLWVRRYNGAGNVDDDATALVVDDSGNVYVTGSSQGIGSGGWDYATIKYAPNGDSLWVRRYNSPAKSWDIVHAIAVDDRGNVYVTGESWNIGSAPNDYTTIKYSPIGETLWVRRYSGLGGAALAVDDSGNVYVTGNPATIKYLPNGDTAWVRTGYYYPRAIAVDDSGNTYVTGWSYDRHSFADYATVKYAPNGDGVWVKFYDGTGNGWDDARALAVDDSGNVYVTGFSAQDSVRYPGASNYDYATIKYAPNGDTLWVRRYNGQTNGTDYASALAVDDSGNVYVTGGSDLECYYYNLCLGGNYATIKYDSDGDTLWVGIYHRAGADYEHARALVVDDSGNVYVTGESANDYTTLKYVPSCFARGDVDGDGLVRLSDVIGIVNFVFRDSPVPEPLCRGDADSDGNILFPDIIYLVNFIFKSGPAPEKTGACCL